MVHNCFLRFRRSDGRVHSHVVFRDSLPLTHGKYAWALFAAGHAFALRPQAHGHTGIVVAHHAFDRAAFRRLQRMYKQKLAIQNKSSQDRGGSPLCDLLEWAVATPCALHDTHNAFKWSLHLSFQDRTLMKYLYIALQSLRNSYDQVHRFLGPRVVRRLAFCSLSSV